MTEFLTRSSRFTENVLRLSHLQFWVTVFIFVKQKSFIWVAWMITWINKEEISLSCRLAKTEWARWQNGASASRRRKWGRVTAEPEASGVTEEQTDNTNQGAAPPLPLCLLLTEGMLMRARGAHKDFFSERAWRRVVRWSTWSPGVLANKTELPGDSSDTDKGRWNFLMPQEVGINCRCGEQNGEFMLFLLLRLLSGWISLSGEEAERLSEILERGLNLCYLTRAYLTRLKSNYTHIHLKRYKTSCVWHTNPLNVTLI